MNIAIRKAAQRLGALESAIQIADSEVKSLGRGMRLADGRHVEDLEGHGAAFEINTRACLFASIDAQELVVERYGGIEIADLKVKPEEVRDVGGNSPSGCFSIAFFLVF